MVRIHIQLTPLDFFLVAPLGNTAGAPVGVLLSVLLGVPLGGWYPINIPFGVPLGVLISDPLALVAVCCL